MKTKQYKFTEGHIIKDKNRNIIIVKQIRKTKGNGRTCKGYIVKCNIDGYEYEVSESHLYNGTGCPVCANKVIIKEINSVWATDNEKAINIINREIAFSKSRMSTYKTEIQCPSCKRIKEMSIAKYIKYGIMCPKCSDGKSYPEKFIFSLLEQLGVDFEIEKVFEWSENRRYDFYIPSLNCIIETHGRQHYDGMFYNIGGRTLQQEQTNDELKRKLAFKNGIKYYFELNCKESNMEWVKDSIFNSEFNILFNLENIDWIECDKFATNSIVAKVADLRNQGMSRLEIQNILKISKSCTQKYLKKGNDLGLCSYQAKEEMRVNGNKNGEKTGKKIKCLDNGEIFNSSYKCAEWFDKNLNIKITPNGISRVCRGLRNHHKGFHFIYI